MEQQILFQSNTMNNNITVDSTIPASSSKSTTPSMKLPMQCCSTSSAVSNLVNVISTGEQDKKTANSIRGILHS